MINRTNPESIDEHQLSSTGSKPDLRESLARTRASPLHEGSLRFRVKLPVTNPLTASVSPSAFLHQLISADSHIRFARARRVISRICRLPGAFFRLGRIRLRSMKVVRSRYGQDGPGAQALDPLGHEMSRVFGSLHGSGDD